VAHWRREQGGEEASGRRGLPGEGFGWGWGQPAVRPRRELWGGSVEVARRWPSGEGEVVWMCR
jgi:hypothetical protein